MVSEAPDPKTLSSCEDAFQYPIPVVRGMEKQLRREIDSNREKLRTLVGASYRDLLGTAETITEMDGQMQEVETLMGDIGRRYSARLAFTSQLALFRSCTDVISTLLRTASSVLLVAKVLVISRLLHNKLSKRPNPPPYIETVRGRLANLRRRILGRIDRRFKSLEIERETLVDAMCAFSLATSSGPTDVIRHFHHLRLEAISEHICAARGKHEDILDALRLYIKTLRDTQTVALLQLSQALGKLKTVSIFKSRELYDLVELNLDLHERWIGEDIKSFTPFVRHSDLSKADTERMLKHWAKQAVKTFLDGLKNSIMNVEDPGELMQLRQQVLQLWLGQHQDSLGIDSGEVLDGLRHIFNEHGRAIIQMRVTALKQVGLTVEGIIRAWQSGEPHASLSVWSLSMGSRKVDIGNKAFPQRLLELSTGQDERVQNVTALYKSWLQSVQVIEEIIKLLRGTKWFEEIDNVDDDDDVFSAKKVLLCQDDPQALEDALSAALREAFTELENHLSSIASRIHDDEHQGHQAVLLLRVWREVRRSLPQSFRDESLGREKILKLLHLLAKAMAETPLDQCSTRVAELEQTAHLPARQLWDGDPELPVLPSPWSYRLLLEIVQSMADYGADVWSPGAVRAVKEVLAERLSILLEMPLHTASKVDEPVNADLNEADEPVDSAGIADGDGEHGGASMRDGLSANDNRVNGDLVHGDPPPVEAGQDIKVQKLFDIFYLSNALAIKEMDDNETGLAKCQRSMIQVVALEAKLVERMRKSAAEYWKRTSLLFGLLA
ncbi:MAG: hypothetical protein Q9163_000674 [Psora crenata]